MCYCTKVFFLGYQSLRNLFWLSDIFAIQLDASGRPDESLSLEVVGLLHKSAEESLGKLLSFSLQKGQLKANICYQPTVSANLEVYFFHPFVSTLICFCSKIFDL